MLNKIPKTFFVCIFTQYYNYYTLQYMKLRLLILTAITLFIFAILWNGLVHMVILKEFDMQIAELRRPEMSMGLSILVTFLLCFMFSFGYHKWCRSFSQKETIEYSLFLALLIGIMVNLNQYVIYPIPGLLALTWFGFGIIEFLIYGQIARLIHKIVSNKKRNPE